MTTRETGRRLRLALAFACLACAAGAAPARGEFPLALRADGGVGGGSARSNGARVGGPAGLGAVDLLWRVRPAWTPLLGGRVGGVDDCFACSKALAPVSSGASVSGAGLHSFLVGAAWRRPAGVTPWLSGALGVGRVEPAGRRQRAGTGVALDGALGFQIAPDPGPVGFVVVLRNHHVITGDAHAQALTFGAGLTIYPR
jgi:hypothetical protein